MANYNVERISYNSESDASRYIQNYLNNLALEQGAWPKYFIQTFGCQQNESDSEKLSGILEGLGYAPGISYEDADLILINTCSIRENADQRLFGHLGELKAMQGKKPHIKIAVCGCLPTQEEQNLKIRRSFSNVNLLFGPQDIHRLPQLLQKMYQRKKLLNAVTMENVVCEDIPVRRERKFRALVSIMYGCNNFCTYCMVPAARERERSRYWQDILAECREIADSGTAEVMLLGQNVNAWGFDFKESAARSVPSLEFSDKDLKLLSTLREGNFEGVEINSFPRLLAAIASIPGIKTIRYMSPHPRDFGGEMLAALKVVPEIENHIHLPLQSGSDKVLEKMNRHYSSTHYLELVKAIRKVREDISITTDIMVGFPTETEEDFEETLKLCREAKFAAAFSFIYSERPGTVAANWEQIPLEIRHQRFDRLLELLQDLTLKENESLVGTKRLVLIEGCSKQDNRVLSARDSEFHLINITAFPENSLPSEAYTESGELNSRYFEARFALVEIEKARPYSVEAKLLELR